MIVTWKFPIAKNELSEKEVEQLVSKIKLEIGFDDEEVTHSKNTITAAPQLGRRIWGMQTFRIALYDLNVKMENQDLVFKFRFYTLYAISFLVAFVFGLLVKSLIGFGIAFVFFALVLCSIKWVENKIHKSRLEKAVIQIFNQSRTTSKTNST